MAIMLNVVAMWLLHQLLPAHLAQHRWVYGLQGEAGVEAAGAEGMEAVARHWVAGKVEGAEVEAMVAGVLAASRTRPAHWSQHWTMSTHYSPE